MLQPSDDAAGEAKVAVCLFTNRYCKHSLRAEPPLERLTNHMVSRLIIVMSWTIVLCIPELFSERMVGINYGHEIVASSGHYSAVFPLLSFPSVYL